MPNIVMFKSQLQEYAQKASMPMPVYETTREGPPHNPKFKAAVIVNGVRFDSPSNFRNLKAAEHAAAQVALQDLLEKTNGQQLAPNPVHDTGLCKNLLQEYTQKMSLPLPTYCCERSGKIHLPTFVCTVEVSGVQYTGGVAHSKKEAEIKAARTALLALQAQTCDSEVAVPNIFSSEAAVSNSSTSQLEFSPRKRDREVEMLSEEHETVKSKQKRNSGNSTHKDEMSKENNSRKAENSRALSVVEDSQVTPSKEPEIHSQQVSAEMQQDQDQVEREVLIQAKEEESEKLQDREQIPQEVDLKKKKKGRKGAKGARKSKNQRKKTRNGGQQNNLSTPEHKH